MIEPGSVSLIVTSPPYLNNYHYVRNTRPQMYWLGYASSPGDLRRLEETNFGRFWQTVRELDPIGLDFELPELEAQIAVIRALNPDKGIYGGNGWANYAATYYNDTIAASARGRAARARRRGGLRRRQLAAPGRPPEIDEHFGAIGELHGLVCEDIHVVREKRVGSSIVNTGSALRRRRAVRLYDAATVLRKPGSSCPPGA